MPNARASLIRTARASDVSLHLSEIKNALRRRDCRTTSQDLAALVLLDLTVDRALELVRASKAAVAA
jgi:hypothetical protein